ncbi:MAG TPA: hypothetical protein VMT34_11305, partial [Aggregatilineales bacterium]|nr:hypothetical protein [Aggregatilineales bacterium]
MIRRRHLLIIALVALAARTALLVLFYVIQGRTIEGISGGDAGAYLAMAHYVYYGHDLSSSLFLPRPLLFPVLAASVYQVIGERPMIIVTINLV